jgi:hypothetical protein
MAKPHRIHRHVGALVEDGADVSTKPDEMTWRDYVILLLHIASGIEHALMVEYLYAAYSLDPLGAPRGERERIARWQAQILKIAKEEMGHLLSVQNVLTLLGGPLSLDREDFPWDSPFYPFPFRLEPLSLGSLACYVFTEMPGPDKDELNDDERRKIAARVNDHIRSHDPDARQPGDERTQPHHVGKLYTLLISILEDVERIPESAFQARTYSQQASFAAWGKSYAGGIPRGLDGQNTFLEHDAHLLVEQMPTRQAAVAALKALAQQGEAADLYPQQRKASKGPSHYDRFIHVYREMEDLERGGWSPPQLVAVNPVVPVAGSAPPPSEYTVITCPRSAAWARLFNLRYRMLLSYLEHALRLMRVRYSAQPNLGDSVMHSVFAEMYNLKTIAGLLMRRPLSNPEDPRRSGPPFQLPYTLALPAGDADCWGLHRSLLRASQSLCANLTNGQAAAGATGADEAAYLASMIHADRNSLHWVDRILTGIDLNGGNH